MTNDITSKLKEFKKNLVKFKKLVSKDKDSSNELAKELVKDCDLILSRSDIGLKENQIDMLNKTKEGLILYIDQVKALKEFETKWK